MKRASWIPYRYETTEMPDTEDERLLVDVGDNLWFPLLKYVRSLVSKGDSI